MSEHIDCLHEELLQGQTRKIASLEARADYKEKMINELNDSMKEVQKSMKSLEKTINQFILQSVNDDGNIKELINKQDNRITALETTNRTLKWVITIGFTALSSIVALLTFFITHIH